MFQLAAFSIFLLAVILTLSPAVRYRSWNVDYRWSHWLAFLIWLIGASIIHRITIKYCENWDPIILPAAFLLVGWGMITIWRLSFGFGMRQSLWYIIAILLAFFFFKIENVLDTLKKYKYFILILGMILAVLTFFFGTYPGGEGPNLWLGFHGIYFQPSEPLKIILIIYLAAFFSEKYFLKFDVFQTILPTLILVLTALFILVGQRDMGTALIFIVIYIGMLYTIFGKKRILGIGAFIVALAAIIGYFFIDLIRIRFQAWMQPWLDPQSGSYQIIQSIIAIAAGGVFGSGIGIGNPGLVPIPHSDFIYSTIVEETGLVGSIGLISLFSIVLFRGIHAAIKASNKFYRFLASGISIFLIFQAILIIGGNIRLLPITGVTLPLVSYGGSSLITSMLAVFFLVKISDSKPDQLRDQKGLISQRNIAILLSAGLFLLALATGWWAVIRSNDLQLRPDNARNLIAARYVKRGAFLDRNGAEITRTNGDTGSYEQEIIYPTLSNTIGIYSRTYGITSLEEKFNDYLSGQRGYPANDIWFNYLLYDQPLPGRDIKLTLDLQTQETLDTMLKGYQGSAVVLNAATGEILAISNSPYFDANSLEENWDEWRSDASSPFLNRASQGAYPFGELLTPFLLAEDESVLGAKLASSTAAAISQCATGATNPELWSTAVSNGCKNALRLAMEEQTSEFITQSISKYGLNASIDIGLPIHTIQNLDSSDGWQDLVYGDNRIRVSPLQAAYAVSIFSNQGKQSDPQILSAINTEQEGWIVVEKSESQPVISAESATNIARLLTSDVISGWEISTLTEDENGAYSWYIAGTPSTWNSTPVVIVIVSENGSAENLRSIGQQIYKMVTKS